MSSRRHRQTFPVPVRSLRTLPGSVALAVLLAGCTMVTTQDVALDLKPSPVPVTVDTVTANDDLVRLGKGQHGAILSTYGGVYDDPQLELMVAGIVGKLVAVSPNPEQTYRVTLLNSPQINAFALPGGFLYVTRGLIGLANDSSELAAVIAHEMAHVIANHGIERQRLEAREALASEVIQAVSNDAVEAKRTELKGQMRLAQFSREQELEADRIGIGMIGAAGYDPYAAARFQRSMAAYSALRRSSGEKDSGLDFLSSHPSAPQREAKAEARAREIGPPGAGTRARDRYLDGIDGLLYGDTPEEGFVRGNSFIHPGLGVAFSVPQDFTIDNTDTAVLATGPGDAALRFDGAPLPANVTLKEYLSSGWITGLQPETIRSITVAGQEAVSAQARARDWRFDVTVVRVGTGVYRILTAVPLIGDPEPLAVKVRDSFRLLSEAERRSIEPLRIHVIKSSAGETPATIAGRMTEVAHPQELFRILNALGPASGITAGERLKTVSSK